MKAKTPLVTDSCAFLPCDQVSECALVGGCIHDKKRQVVKREPPRTMVYNPATGGREDLRVFEEGEEVAAKRWREKRMAYLKSLLDGDLSAETRKSYERELKKLR